MCRDVKAPVLNVENQQRSIHKTRDALKRFIGDAENRWIHSTPSIRIILSCVYLLTSHFENFLT